MFKISIVGAGYVGVVSAACLSGDGHHVIAVDVNEERVAAINAGSAPIFEPGLAELIAEGVAAKRLSATTDIADAVAKTDISFVCVGTPSRPNGSLDTDHCVAAARLLGKAIATKETFHSVVYRSTILPGTMDDLIIPALEEASGMRAGEGFGVAYYPEFLRESTAIRDHYESSVIVFGKVDQRTIAILTDIVSTLPSEPIIVPITDAEAVKYTNNCWHALKISFANEIGNLCKVADIDSHTIMEILCRDTRLNISPAYLKPGFAFGGSCLPKDLRAFRYFGRSNDIATPVLDAASSGNELQIDRAVQHVLHSGARRVGLHGLTFKTDTDDLRESPLVEFAERVIGKGIAVSIYDENLLNRNEHMVLDKLPHLKTRLVPDLEHLLGGTDMIVIGKKDRTAAELINRARDILPVFDLVRVHGSLRSGNKYDGLSW